VKRALRVLKWVVATPIIFFLTLNTLLRVLRRWVKFPTPAFMVGVLDNPLRWRLQHIDRIAPGYGIEPGMTVMEVGPGNGKIAEAIARYLGPAGKLVVVDIQPEVVSAVESRLRAAGLSNAEGRVADVHKMDFADESFDAVYMVGVIGEIPQPEKAIEEMHRILKPGGLLAFTEAVIDPDYQFPSTLAKRFEPLGFRIKRKLNKTFAYNLVFERVDE
jgi:ubiquinone/menaquinone biosynthesis C-methylase UbiE